MNDPVAPNRYSLTEAILPMLRAYRKVVYARADKFNQADIDDMYGVTLQNTRLVDSPNVEGCLDYVFAYMEPHRTDGMHAFYFVKAFTDAERRDIILTEGGNRYYNWPDVLKELSIDFDDNFPLAAHFGRGDERGVSTIGRPIIMRSMVLGGYIKSTIRVNHYLSDTVFPPTRFRTPQPIPGEIYLPYIGVTDNRIVCLHKTETTPARPTAYKNLTTTNGGFSGGFDAPEQKFPATNFTDWDEFTLEADQQFVQGIWHMWEAIIEPPEQKPPVIIYS